MSRPLTGCRMVTAVALIVTACGLAGCSSETEQPRLSVVRPYVPLPASPEMAAGYLTVRNEGGSDDQLLRVTSDLADDISMHRVSGSHMERVDAFDIPAGGELSFRRGGNHLMLEGFTRALSRGGSFTVTLHFAKSRPMDFTMPVKSLTYRP